MAELLLGRQYEHGSFGGKWSDSEITANVTKSGKLSEPPIRIQMPAMSLVLNLTAQHYVPLLCIRIYIIKTTEYAFTGLCYQFPV